jgi:MFS family permease
VAESNRRGDGAKRPKGGTFHALKDRNFRWFWLSRVAGSASMNMMRVAQGWLIYDITQSALSLSWVNSARSLILLTLSLFGGAICDRLDKRLIMMAARSGYLIGTTIIGTLILTGSIQVWHLVAYSLVQGLMSSFMMPAQQAIVSELVDRQTLMNAVSLNSIGMGLTGIFASMLAGYMVDEIGPEAVYFFIAGLYLLALISISRLPKAQGTRRSSVSPLRDVKEVIGYLRRQPILILLLSLTLSRALFHMPYRTYLPVYASDVLGFSATGLGFLTSAPSLGSLIGSLVMASLGDFRHKGRLHLFGGLVVGLAMLLWANMSSYPLVLLGMVLMGFAGNATMVTGNTLLQTNSDPKLRGRVMSAYMMVYGLTPVSTIPFGALADRVGVPIVISAMAVLLLLAFVSALVFAPQISKLE